VFKGGLWYIALFDQKISPHQDFLFTSLRTSALTAEFGKPNLTSLKETNRILVLRNNIVAQGFQLFSVINSAQQ
jgi:hypothetical protein